MSVDASRRGCKRNPFETPQVGFTNPFGVDARFYDLAF